MKKISKNTTLSEILKIQGAEKILTKYRVPCLSCPMARFEIDRLRIGQVCQIYGIEAKKLIKDLNKKQDPNRTQADK